MKLGSFRSISMLGCGSNRSRVLFIMWIVSCLMLICAT